jgi:hypothetical protein
MVVQEQMVVERVDQAVSVMSMEPMEYFQVVVVEQLVEKVHSMAAQTQPLVVMEQMVRFSLFALRHM